MVRGTSNKNVTGSSYARRARKQWLLDTFGDGTTVMCAFECGTELDFDTLTVDRFPIPGCEGGSYRRDNIRPACARCNYKSGSDLGHERKAAKKVALAGAVG